MWSTSSCLSFLLRIELRPLWFSFRRLVTPSCFLPSGASGPMDLKQVSSYRFNFFAFFLLPFVSRNTVTPKLGFMLICLWKHQNEEWTTTKRALLLMTQRSHGPVVSWHFSPRQEWIDFQWDQLFLVVAYNVYSPIHQSVWSLINFWSWLKSLAYFWLSLQKTSSTPWS